MEKLLEILFTFLVLSSWNSVYFLVEGYPEEYPNVYPNTTTVRPGATVIFSCHAVAPVKWIPFYNFEGIDRLTIENETNTGPHPYTSRLTLTDVSFVDVGFYECSYLDDDNGIYASFSYIFVEDQQNVLVKHGVHLIETATIGVEFTFESCKPTSENVRVTLTHDNNLIDPNLVTYDVKKGYTINQVVTTSGGMYRCTGTRGSVTQYFGITLLTQGEEPKFGKPVINATRANSIAIGQTFVLDCIMETKQERYWSVNWTDPRDIISSSRATLTTVKLPTDPNYKKFRSTLTVRNAQKSDGNRDYVCFVTGRSTASYSKYKMKVFGPNDGYLHANATDEGNITVNASGDAQWVIDVHGFPMPSDYYWRGPLGNELTNKGGRYSVEFLFNQVVVSIKDVTMEDGGSYLFIARNNEREVSLDLFLTVRDSPKVQIKGARKTMYLTVNKLRSFECVAKGYPYPTIEWYFQKCRPGGIDSEGFTDCDEFELLNSAEQELPNIHENAPRQTFRSVKVNVTNFGNLKCVASNDVGNGTDELSVTIIPIDFVDTTKEGFDVNGNSKPIEGDDVELTCAVTKINSTNNNKWYYKDSNQNNVPAESLEGVKVTYTSTNWSYKSTLKISNILLKHAGDYICYVDHSNGGETVMEKSVSMKILALQAPFINDTNLNGTAISKNPGDRLETLYCRASGVPAPNISWFKDDIPFGEWPSQDQIILENNQLTLGFLKTEHSGTYKCNAKNKVGTAEKLVTVSVEEAPPVVGIIIGILAVLIIIILVIALTHYIRNERKMKIWLKKLQLDEFENGDVEKINPEESVDAQVNLLPYDKKYEFPRDRLTLGIRLGSGAFGLVLKGEAKGIRDGEASTTVAVKMVKPNADESHFKALMSELKIMIHLEQHVNVVNLLGACTKQLVKKRELLVIVEFCKYGSLLNYVHRHRKDFIDQLDRVRDVIDPNICYYLDAQCQSPPPRLNYAALTFTDSGNTERTSVNGYHTMDQLNIEQTPEEDCRRVNRKGNERPEEYVQSSNVQSNCTGMSFLSNSPMSDGHSHRRSSSSSGWNGNYHGVYNYKDIKSLTTSDLLCWSFQIARGMEYLASRKILHGDLAARNVLLADNNVVKICDFGLSKEMCEEKYKKKSEGVPLPVKWMALEAIYFQIFSTQSDVWSFGVVMWELFTLGKTPYPGMEVDEHFYKMLNEGYRMEKPVYAPSSIYDLMESCWDIQPSARPTFTGLSEQIGNLIQDGVRQHYIDLNAPYSLMNERRRQEGREDYLSRMSRPDYNCSSKRGTPDRTYANVLPVQSENEELPGPSNMVRPNTLSVPHPAYGQQKSDNYQNFVGVNVESNEEPPAPVQMLANNAGYYFMNRSDSTESPGPKEIFSPRPQLEPQESNPSRFNFHNDKTVSLPKEIKGVSNMNYLPNHIFSPANNGKDFQDIIDEAEASNKISDLQEHDAFRDSEHRTRQKNDSGVSSIDSNFEINNSKGSSPPLSNGTASAYRNEVNNSSDNNMLRPHSPHHQTKFNESQNNLLSNNNVVPIPILSTGKV